MADNQDPSGLTDQGDNEPKFVTPEQLNQTLNKAISARFADFEKKLGKMAPNLDQFKADLEASLLDKFKTPEPTTPSQPKSQPDPEFAGMKKRLADTEAALKRVQEEKEAERRVAKESQLRQRLSEELSNLGIESSYLRQAVGWLADADKRVRWNDDGDSLVFRDSDGTDVDLGTGLKSWVQSDDAKVYLPARSVSGTGSRPTNRVQTPRKATGSKPITTSQGEQVTSSEIADALHKLVLDS